jgi:hypothetical protein
MMHRLVTSFQFACKGIIDFEQYDMGFHLHSSVQLPPLLLLNDLTFCEPGHSFLTIVFLSLLPIRVAALQW